ncbi:transmembrane protein 64-like isoform X1 [Rhagoletis pomonella]|uniref:transmembrane protein 64-like isoform X1 n=1 Tax=Rhagoletis pomonella TaxID=28610 RepID=UPI001781B5A2|nr:transmembrane protein 64-like isoform X1 [Rhagoletis pomonella]
MNATVNRNAVPSSDRLQLSFYQKNNNNKPTYYYFPQVAKHKAYAMRSRIDGENESHDIEEEKATDLRRVEDPHTTNSAPTRAAALFFDEHSILLENTSRIGAISFPLNSLHKSNSYSGVMRPKATVLRQDSLNGRIATSLTDDGITSSTYKSALYTAASSNNDLVSNTLNNYDDDAVVDFHDEHDLLMPSATNAAGSAGVGGSNGNASSLRRNTRGAIKARNTACNRLSHNRKCLFGLALLLLAITAFMFFAYLTRDYTKQFLLWIEMQNPWIIVAILIALFVVVSFPIVVGYFLLMLTSGYLFGALKGVLIVVVGANLGVAVAHWTIRSFRHRIPIHKLIKNETGRSILRVISGPKAFKVVLFTRLTPIPFGLQNTIFAVSAINPRVYHTASLLGLMPAQMINAYLGSTLRSMQEVLSSHGGAAVSGYISFGLEVICGVGLMVWVIQKARKELAETLLSDLSNEEKLIEIDV